jgi:hypothetical protein
MGSYCSVYNNYPEPMFVKYSANSLPQIVGTVLTAGAIVATSGAAAPTIGIVGGLVDGSGLMIAGTTGRNIHK